MCSNFTSVFVVGVMVFFTIHLSTLAHITLRRAQGESKSDALSDLRNKAIAQNLLFILRKARPGTQRDRPLMRPVTAPCDHDPPSRFPVGTRSPRLDPPDKASDRPLMRPVTVALSSLPRHETDLRSIAMTARPWAGGAKREVGSGPAARGSAASGCEGNEPHQRGVRAPDASCERVTERYACARSTATNTMRSMV